MNKLPIEKKVQIIQMLVEGNSLRATSRMANVSKDTVAKLLCEVGAACEKFHNDTVVNVEAARIQGDEIWSFCYSKEKNKPQEIEGAGDVWTWTALDPDSKLIVSWNVGYRSPQAAKDFMLDLSSRLKNRVQLTTDGLKAYRDAVYAAFDLDVDFAQLVKHTAVVKGQIQTKRNTAPLFVLEVKRSGYEANPTPYILAPPMSKDKILQCV